MNIHDIQSIDRIRTEALKHLQNSSKKLNLVYYSDSDHKQSKVGLSEKNHTHILLLQPKQTCSR